MAYSTNPSSKEDLMDRLLSRTFTGDLRELAKDPVKISRPKPHMLSMEIAGKIYLLAIHRPKPEEARIKARERWKQRQAGQAQKNAGRSNHQQETHREDPMGRYSQNN